MIELSIIIVSWNVRSLLRNCLLSIQENVDQSMLDGVEVVVVDNASQDNTVDMLRNHFPWVQVIANDVNEGFAQANNRGIRSSGGKFLLLLNPDTELEPDALKKLLEFMHDHPAVGAVGPRLLNPDRTLQPSCYLFPTLFNEFWRLFHLDFIYRLAVYPMDTWSTDIPHEVNVVKGAAILVRHDIVERIGLLDEDYFMYTEEVDWCRRIHDAGWELYWVPTAQVIHYGGQSTRLAAEKMFIELYRSKLQYIRKHSGPPAGHLYKLILLGAALARILGTPLAMILHPENRTEQATLARRYGRLIRALPRLETT